MIEIEEIEQKLVLESDAVNELDIQLILDLLGLFQVSFHHYLISQHLLRYSFYLSDGKLRVDVGD